MLFGRLRLHTDPCVIFIASGRLALADNNLFSTIPPEVGFLSQLEFLDLGSNQLTGSIPGALGSIQTLGKHSFGRFLYELDTTPVFDQLLENLKLTKASFCAEFTSSQLELASTKTSFLGQFLPNYPI